MMEGKQQRAIWIVTEAESGVDEGIEGERWGRDTGGGFGTRRGASDRPSGPKAVSVPFETLKKNADDFLAMVGELFDRAERQQSAGMRLDEVELAVEINGEGQLSLLGTGGKVGGKGAITLKFKRESSD